MQASARNQIKGTIKDIKTDKVSAHLDIDIGNGNTISSLITNQSVQDMDLKVGDEVKAMIKSTAVIVSK